MVSVVFSGPFSEYDLCNGVEITDTKCGCEVLWFFPLCFLKVLPHVFLSNKMTLFCLAGFAMGKAGDRMNALRKVC